MAFVRIAAATSIYSLCHRRAGQLASCAGTVF